MSDVGQHLTYFSRRSLELASDKVDFSPLILIPSVLIQHNKMHSRVRPSSLLKQKRTLISAFKDMLAYTETVLRALLTRLNVSKAALMRIVHVTSSLFKRSIPTQNSQEEVANRIVLAIFEIVGDSFRMKVRPRAETLSAMISVRVCAPLVLLHELILA